MKPAGLNSMKIVLRMILCAVVSFSLLGGSVFAMPYSASKSEEETAEAVKHISAGDYEDAKEHPTTHYFAIRRYLEQFERDGGGTLVFRAGTYIITNTLYVPSNVTLIFEDGVTLLKGSETRASFPAAHSMFQLIRPSLWKARGAVGAHDGEANIQFLGKGKVTIDLAFMKDSLAIISGHNTNLRIDNIQFQNMNAGHFIEIDGTKDAVISNCSFKYSKKSKNVNKEAINIDTPDRETEGWSQEWSLFDKTPNENLSIIGCTFYDLDRAIGTHKYSENQYHKNILIEGNTIEKTRNDAIRVMNWSDPVIRNNVIRDVNGGKKSRRGILISGAIHPVIEGNTFDKSWRAMEFIPWKNYGPASQYATTYNELTEANKETLKNNVVLGVHEDFVRIYRYYMNYSKGLEKVYLKKQK